MAFPRGQHSDKVRRYPEFRRISPEAELALFDLQEGLTMCHRHSGSASAAVKLSQLDGEAVLEDFKIAEKEFSPNCFRFCARTWPVSVGVGLRGRNAPRPQLGGKLKSDQPKRKRSWKPAFPLGDALDRLSRSA